MGSSNQKLILAVTMAAIVSLLLWNWTVRKSSAYGSDDEPAISTEVVKLWTDNLPGGKLNVGQEKDATKPTDDLIAGKRVIRLGNVEEPELHVFLPPPEKANGTSVLVCPGGGFTILAWDLEGTEVAAWLNSIGVAACVLKYRVPTRTEDNPWLIPLQDTQRALSTMRSRAGEWNLDKDRVGVMGFSAGAIGALRSGTTERMYEAKDGIDNESSKPNFVILAYAGQIADDTKKTIRADIKIDAQSPPVFIVHTYDDFVPVENCLVLVDAYQKASVPIEFHLYDQGGHGYGMRPIKDVEVTQWGDRCEVWLEKNGWLNSESP